MRIFLDVGAHEGQTLEEVLRHDFDHIHAFEPMPAEFATLTRLYGHHNHVTLHQFGLYNQTTDRLLYGRNDAMEASVFAAKVDVDEAVATMCSFVSASEFVGQLDGDAEIVMKLNCEGAEIAILDDLCDSGLINQMAMVLIDFDIRKVPGQQAEEGRILGRLQSVGFTRYLLVEDVMRGETHAIRTAAWLAIAGY